MYLQVTCLLSSIPPMNMGMLKNAIRYSCWLGRKEPTWDEVYKEHREKAGKDLGGEVRGERRGVMHHPHTKAGPE